MTYRVQWTRQATKQLLKLDTKQRLLLANWVKENLDNCPNPRSIPGGKSLQGTTNGWRWRVGNYRILGKIEDEVLLITVVRVGHRQGVYQHLTGL